MQNEFVLFLNSNISSTGQPLHSLSARLTIQTSAVERLSKPNIFISRCFPSYKRVTCYVIIRMNLKMSFIPFGSASERWSREPIRLRMAVLAISTPSKVHNLQTAAAQAAWHSSLPLGHRQYLPMDGALEYFSRQRNFLQQQSAAS